ncbi:MAG: hypothetical protein IJV15_05580 [Lachnospiraceae bacterium]|nr:hypothetical protein [Lachnospiraceae bacterium]
MENRINGPHRLFDFQGAVTVEILYGIDINIKAYIRLGAIATYRILKILRTGNSINIPDIRIIIDPLDPYNYYVKGYDFIDELYLMNNKGDGMKYDRVENLHNEKRDAGIENIFKVIMLVSYIGIATLMTIVVVQEFAHIHSEHEFYISLVFIGIFMIMLSIVSVQMLIEEFIVYYIRFHKK